MGGTRSGMGVKSYCSYVWVKISRQLIFAFSLMLSMNAPASLRCNEYASVGGGVSRYFIKVPP